MDLSIIKEEIPKVNVKTEKVDIPQSTSKQKPSNKIQQQTNPTKNMNFTPHNYQNTDFSKYHNQSKESVNIAQRLQKVIL